MPRATTAVTGTEKRTTPFEATGYYALLAERWPKCFVVHQSRRKPLKLARLSTFHSNATRVGRVDH
jgi:hypothetical protein